MFKMGIRIPGRGALIFFLAVVLACSLYAQDHRVEKRAPSLLLVSIDTWRWDYIGASGSGKVRTPHLDALVEDGYYCGKAVSAYPLTTPAHATMFTGLMPDKHGVLDCINFKLPKQFRTIAEAFKEKGYSTAAFVGGEPLGRRYGLDRGFEVYDDSGMSRRAESDPFSASRSGKEVLNSALAYLQQQKMAAPLFLFVHFYDLHSPYKTQKDFSGQYPGDAYASETAYVDDLVGRLVSWTRNDRSRSWRVIVVSDHGEGLGDHGESGHGIALYGSTVHVPLIISPKPEGIVGAKQWSLADLAPTICDWMGLPPIEGADGISMLSKDSQGAERRLYFMTVFPSIMFGVTPCFGIERGRYVYLDQGKDELYDIQKDPGEKINVSGDREMAQLLQDLSGLVKKRFDKNKLQDCLVPSLDISQKELESLRGLGYIDGPMPQLAKLQKWDIGNLLKLHSQLEKAQRTAFEKRDLTRMALT